MVGRSLIPVLRASGLQTVGLSRPYTDEALEGVTTIINLAGESLSAGRWTAKRKKRIIDSRVNTLKTLKQLLTKRPNQVKTLISASAVGYYGTITSGHVYSENDPPGTDFLADVCREWEAEAETFKELGIRVVVVRIGVVLTAKGGALPKLMIPMRFGISVPFGSGDQWIPWIHPEDLAGAFLHLLKTPGLSGPFNAVAPDPIRNRELMKLLASVRHRLYIPIGVPAFLMKAVLGEMAVVTLEGSQVSPQKLIHSGFEFQFQNPRDACIPR